MQLTPRSLWLLLPAVLLLVLAAWWSWSSLLALGWLVVWAAVLMADWRMMPDRRVWSLSRHHDERLSLAANNRITLRVNRRGSGPALPISLRDDFPATFALVDSPHVLTGVSVPGQTLELSYQVRPPRRGDYRFGNLHLRWHSTLGFLLRQTTFEAAAPVKVYPNLVDVRKYDQLLRRNKLHRREISQPVEDHVGNRRRAGVRDASDVKCRCCDPIGGISLIPVSGQRQHCRCA